MSAYLLAAIASILLSAIVVLLLRAEFGKIDPLPLTFDTTPAKARRGWSAFFARDPFVQAMRTRTGMAFGTYDIPGGDEKLTTHLAATDALQHTLLLGSTGSGKSSMLEVLARYHLREKRGFTLLDLHGDLFTRVASWALVEKPLRLTLLDFTRPDLLPGWNPLNAMPDVDPGRQVDLLVGVFKRLYAGEDAASWAWGVKVEELMRQALRALITSASPMTIVDLPSFFLLPGVRQGVLATAARESQVYFATRFSEREKMYVSAALNKIEPFLGSIAVQRFFGQPKSTVDLFGAIERGDTILINLAKGYLGPASDVTGRLLVNVLQTAALGRERVAPEKRTPYSLLLDEAHVLAAAGSGLEDFLVAARKYRVFVTLAAQGLSLFPPGFRPHLLGNTGRQFFFRLPHSEAQMLSKDIFDVQGSVFRTRTRPNERMDEPLLTAAEEMAWRTRELAHLPVGTCYWHLKDRPYRARRIQLLKPVDPPYRGLELQRRIDAAMAAQKGIAEASVEAAAESALSRAIAERSARRQQGVMKAQRG